VGGSWAGAPRGAPGAPPGADRGDVLAQSIAMVLPWHAFWFVPLSSIRIAVVAVVSAPLARFVATATVSTSNHAPRQPPLSVTVPETSPTYWAPSPRFSTRTVTEASEPPG